MRATITLNLLTGAAAFYSPPGLLGGLVDQKKREVDALYRLPEARDDGPWGLRLSYPAGQSSYKLARSIGWKRERLAVLADLKRSSPATKLGVVEKLDEQMSVTTRVQHALQHGLAGALVNTDPATYGGSTGDVVTARQYLEALRSEAAAALPIVAKDLFIDPMQIAQAASLGADAVVLIAAAAADVLPELLDTCTLLGLEAIVEVHTRDEIDLAVQEHAPILLVNERDRATGELYYGNACALAQMMPPETTMLACGGIERIDHVRKLRASGYDGVVLGRALAGPRADELLAQIAADNEQFVAAAEEEHGGNGRVVEVIQGTDAPPQPSDRMR
tara:strand:+ start:2076 stop:3074 length:999 start_codon:yes stop_codon:yes gene_type:complete